MPNSDNQDTDDRRPARARFGRHGKLGLAAAGLLAFGAAAGAVVVAESRPSVSMAPATPVAIRSLSSTGIVTIRGRVTEIYGNKFIMADSSGKALVDLGREGDGRQLVTAGEPVTVQGRFDRGFIHAAFLVGPDNKVLALDALARPPHGRPGCPGPDGAPGGPPPPTGADRGPDARSPRATSVVAPAAPAPAPVPN
ncbi:hypothetical protein [uncultured Sphingomonas sp.]|uniref:hypothetical protein n=1 Tax=uncultured Sphingomonas sp. TaxID=158754 RepID=UPI0035CB4AC3